MLVDVMHRCFSCQKEQIELDPDKGTVECQDCHASWSIYESDNPEVAKVVAKDMKCPKCGFEGLPQPSFVCTNCQKPDSYGVFDCQMKIMMIGSADGKSKEMRIEDVVIQPLDSQLFDVKCQGADPEQAQKTVDFFRKPMNLDGLLSEPTADEQATTLGEGNPFNAKGTTNSGFKSYSRPGAAPEQTGEAPEEAPEPEAVASDVKPKIASVPGRVIGKINIRR
jgi:DNA-directed RNA polymerase subunit RPC12/RpoP